jgi:cellulose synthase/poly-beta-1,6-N-acetylglucosamine synthase-like glycosyltransferase
MTNITLSIIIPVYNVEKYLNRCVDSILEKELDSFEIILVDDGSPDGAGAICDEYAARDERVKVIHKEDILYTRDCRVVRLRITAEVTAPAFTSQLKIFRRKYFRIVFLHNELSFFRLK